MRGGYKKSFRKKYKQAKSSVSKPVKTYVKRQISKNIENKYITTVQENQGTTLNGSVSAIAHPDEGLTNANRVGDDFRPVLLEIGFTSKLRTTATMPSVGRFTVFQWKMNNSNPTVSGIYEITGSVNIVNSGFNYANRDQYHILYDKVFKLQINTGEVVQYKKKIYKKAMKRIIISGGTLGSSSGTNKIYYIWADDQAGGSEGTLTSCAIRMFYEDA